MKEQGGKSSCESNPPSDCLSETWSDTPEASRSIVAQPALFNAENDALNNSELTVDASLDCHTSAKESQKVETTSVTVCLKLLQKFLQHLAAE